MDFSTLYFILEIIGTISFAISGAVVGIEKKMDILGISVLGIITAVGGGILRDMIIGITPPLSFRDQTNFLVAIGTLVVFIIAYSMLKDKYSDRFKLLYEEILFISDSVGLGIFTVLGINVGIRSTYNGTFILYLVLGLLTGTGGGIMRDIMAGKIPFVFQKHIYALASLIGGACYILLLKVLDKYSSMLISTGIIILIRYISRKKGLNLPKLS
ncbi:MAG: TRIC cation channel family protein [Eubacteriales bacterium]|nr:TRIC cation channel family protein [Eubacteriales bacterium]